MTESSDWDVPGWPVIAIELSATEVRVNGSPLTLPAGVDLRTAAIQSAASTAQTLGRPVRVEATEADGSMFPLIVAPNATVTEAGPVVPPQNSRGKLWQRRSAGSGGRRDRGPSSSFGLGPAPVSNNAVSVSAGTAWAEPPAPALASPPVPAPTPAPTPLPAARAPQTVPVPAGGGLFANEPTREEPAEANEAAIEQMPVPSTVQADQIRRIEAALQSGHTAQARHLAKALDGAAEQGGDVPAAIAARELLAYTALRDGASDAAAELFAQAAMVRAVHDRDTGVGGVITLKRWAWRLTQNAHYCWLHVDDPETAYSLGPAVIGAYSAVGAETSAAAQAARAHLDELRGRLLAG
ncbi:hypothetical protein [Yinghuangia soli]|uniref:Uncharacterized protein n=1 Tax=Yinghuangia soli TaxID=2908204 RepID=A0AA41PWY7_9ACTN|nr:hypothetical protein [Yinghuangia soli]MCF2526716.1 hypothetical protein [Yinghuangia soli]